MAIEEPKRSADELLRAYARKRRDEAGAPPELHPATRQLLQGEVTRVLGNAATTPTPRPRTAALWWMRLAWGGSVVAAVVVAIMVLSPARKPAVQFQLAQKTKRLAAEPPAQSRSLLEAVREQPGQGPAPPAVAPQPVAGADNERARVLTRAVSPSVGQQLALADGAKLKGTSPSSPPPPPSGGARLERLADRRADEKEALALADRKMGLPQRGILPGQASDGIAEGAMSGKSLPADRRIDRLGESKQSTQASLARAAGNYQSEASLAASHTYGSFAAGVTGANSLRFVQLDSRAKYRQNFNSPALPAVLTAFRVERDQDQIRIVDADGSIYEGRVSTAPAGGSLRGVVITGATELGIELRKDAALSEPRAKASNQPTFQAPTDVGNYAFRAFGTNRLLQQTVEFSGQYVVLTLANDPGSQQSALMRSGLANLAASNGPAGLATAAGVSTNLDLAESQGGAPSATNQSRVGVIEGQVVVGGTNTFNLEAVPTAR